MDFTPKAIVLKNGMTLTLRAPRVEDAKTLIEYLDVTAGESPYLLREPGEKQMTVEADEGRFEEIMERVRKVCAKIEPDCRIVM